MRLLLPTGEVRVLVVKYTTSYFFAKGTKLGLLASKLTRELKRKTTFTESFSKLEF